MNSILEKVIGKVLFCSTCGAEATFEKIEDVECDYGIHILIQCPICEDLFSIDGPCNAFHNLLDLADCNPSILNHHERELYRLSAHSCNLG